jgi:hypothetical protein
VEAYYENQQTDPHNSDGYSATLDNSANAQPATYKMLIAPETKG